MPPLAAPSLRKPHQGGLNIRKARPAFRDCLLELRQSLGPICGANKAKVSGSEQGEVRGQGVGLRPDSAQLAEEDVHRHGADPRERLELGLQVPGALRLLMEPGLPLDFVVLWTGGGGVALGVCGLGRST